MLKMTFELNDIEEGRAKDFIKKHHEKCGTSNATIGGMFTYEITPTGIGLFIKIRCNACGDTQDITDIDSM